MFHALVHLSSRVHMNFVFQQMQITANNVQEVANRVNMIVQTNSTEDQSSENLQVVTDILSDTVDLLGNISVSAEVMMLHILNCVLLQMCGDYLISTILWFFCGSPSKCQIMHFIMG